MPQENAKSWQQQDLSSPPRHHPGVSRPSFDQSPDSPPYNTSFSSPVASNSSIVERLTTERRSDYERTIRPLSSPIRAQPRERRQAERRQLALEQRALRSRGGLDRMQEDIIKLQNDREQRAMAEQAALYSMSPEVAAELESNEQEEEDDEDDELVYLLEEREHCEETLRLEQQQIQDMLSRFSIS